MVALGIDTSTPAGSIGLAEGDSLQGEIHFAAGGHHQERLLRGVDALLDLLVNLIYAQIAASDDHCLTQEFYRQIIVLKSL